MGYPRPQLWIFRTTQQHPIIEAGYSLPLQYTLKILLLKNKNGPNTKFSDSIRYTVWSFTQFDLQMLHHEGLSNSLLLDSVPKQYLLCNRDGRLGHPRFNIWMIEGQRSKVNRFGLVENLKGNVSGYFEPRKGELSLYSPYTVYGPFSISMLYTYTAAGITDNPACYVHSFISINQRAWP